MTLIQQFLFWIHRYKTHSVWCVRKDDSMTRRLRWKYFIYIYLYLFSCRQNGMYIHIIYIHEVFPLFLLLLIFYYYSKCPHIAQSNFMLLYVKYSHFCQRQWRRIIQLNYFASWCLAPLVLLMDLKPYRQ